ncbi:MAG: 16S rRNA (guanine(527)-N(7))-methyltransferase RsmG [Muribaculaceae bacterium]|nr:16S rRNA (guanine(527)-N(7))-methyltransferase RsmG [Muribaculaceae bacterium]
MDEIITQYFPHLSEKQRHQFNQLPQLYHELNEKVNVVSRKDIDNIGINHILHSLAIARYLNFTPGSTVIDLGTGGGLPGIPLAIMFPEVHFHLIDRVGKKVNVAKEIAEALGLENVSFQHGDMGECKIQADFVVSRAVTDQPTLIKISKKNISKQHRNALPNGLITLKGGDVSGELGKYASISEVVPVSNYFSEDFFKTKKIVYTPVT